MIFLIILIILIIYFANNKKKQTQPQTQQIAENQETIIEPEYLKSENQIIEDIINQELQKNGRIPAIFLTAKDDEKDMLKAFDIGADDYVVKPFSIKVLLKRIEVVLKRKSNENTFMCGQVILYSDRKQVFVGETEIFLTVKEYQLLEYLIMNQNQVLTKEMIMENIWGIDSEFIDPNTISVMISRLKKKLNDSSNVISNVFGMGYRMGD